MQCFARGSSHLYDDPTTMSISVSARFDPKALHRPGGLRLEPDRLSDRLSDRLAARIAERIDSGTFKPGDRLPTELQFATAYGVSRTVVREAVHQLKSQGLVRSRQGSGVFVTAPPAHRALAFDPKLLGSMEAVVQMVELRRVVEGEMAALAAKRASRTQLTALRRTLAAIDTATDAGDLGVDEDLAFHRAIAEATGNPQFLRLLAVLEDYTRDAMTVAKAYESMRIDFMEQVRHEHCAILAAITTGSEAAARRAAIRHHRNGEKRLVTSGVIKAARPARARR